MLTGSSPVAPGTLEFFRVVIGCVVVEGYGSTETSAACATTPVWDQTRGGHVGAPLPCCEIRLLTVPEEGLSVSDTVCGRWVDDSGRTQRVGVRCRGRGEILVRGANVTRWYFADPERTEECIDEDGWFHTGDLGMWDVRGRLVVLGRKGEMLRVRGAEIVAAATVEAAAASSPLVAGCFVQVPDDCLDVVAIVVPAHEPVLRWALQRHLFHPDPPPTLDDLCSQPAVRSLLLSEVQKAVSAAGIAPEAVPAAVHLVSDPWTIASGMLTPTLKLRRATAREKYADIISSIGRAFVVASDGARTHPIDPAAPGGGRDAVASDDDDTVVFDAEQ